ncbi:MAG: ABC transporter ATP-binding protein [Sandaracinaceae bacterium]|nr:ABC transporter ATP-binding protein [Sandaracinaceae bacterium]
MTQLTTVVLEAKDIVKTFGEGEAATHVLRGVSTEIRSGEFVALVGPSGSGKSTFLSIAGTLLTPSTGSLAIAGESVLGRNEKEIAEVRNRHLGFVFQFHHLLEDFTAFENVLMPVYGAQARVSAPFVARARRLLQRVGLKDRMEFPTSKLSGGQKQRVAVARALIMKPEIVLADEPTGNLDRKSSDEVLHLLRELAHDEGTAFFVSTHDESIAMRCDRILTMEDGMLSSTKPSLS